MHKHEVKALRKRLRALGYSKRDINLVLGVMLWTSLSSTPLPELGA